jgi:hypothetical protein
MLASGRRLRVRPEPGVLRVFSAASMPLAGDRADDITVSVEA